MQHFIKNRIRSIGIAFNGARKLVKTESSIKVQLFIGILVTIAGFCIGLSPTEWILQTLTITLVISMEGVNTAIEKTADFIHPDHHPKIGFIKDIAAGAVFITAVGAITVGCLIYIPKLF